MAAIEGGAELLVGVVTTDGVGVMSVVGFNSLLFLTPSADDDVCMLGSMTF